MRAGLQLSLMCLLVISLAAAPQAASADGPVITVAVAPFANISKDTQFDWLGYGFAETLATKLCMVPGIQYVERAELSKALRELKLQDTALVDPATASKLGKIVGAKYVIVGSFQKVGEALKVDARVVSVETAVAAKSADDTGTMPGVFDLQASLATKLITVLGREIPESSKQDIARPATKSLSAFEWYFKAWKANESDRFAEAIEDSTIAITLDPSYADAYLVRGLAYHKDQQYDNAIADYHSVIAISPNCADAHWARGSAYAMKGQWEKAATNYDRVITIRPGYRGIYTDRGLAHSRSGEYDKAISDYTRAIAIKPGDAAAYSGRGYVHLKKRWYEKAIADFDKAIALKPDDAPSYWGRAAAKDFKGAYEKAVDDYDTAIRLDPTDPRNYWGRALDCEILGRLAEARNGYEKVVSFAGSSDLPTTTWYVEKARERLKQLDSH